MRRHRRRIGIAAIFVAAVVSLIIDQSTGDATGPPYHDSLLNHIAFFAFFGFAAAFVVLTAVTLIAWAFRRPRATDSA